MEVTVAICTWNRAVVLDQTLTHMSTLRVPAGIEWELLVVNNNCTDDTDAVIERHERSLPLRRLFEPRLGLCNARNCAVGAARGNLIIWTDDDVLVDPEWMSTYLEAAGRWPDAGYFGGTIEPWYEATPPDWVVENIQHLQGALVIRDLGPDERLFRDHEFPFGANMAFRVDVLRAHPFDPSIGQIGGSQVRGDETTLMRELRNQGIRGVWIPRARVKHFVVRQRLTRAYVWDYYVGHGQTVARLDALGHVPRGGKGWFGVPRWLYRRVIESWSIAQWKRLRSRTDWLPHYKEAAVSVGMMSEVRESAKTEKLKRSRNRVSP